MRRCARCTSGSMLLEREEAYVCLMCGERIWVSTDRQLKMQEDIRKMILDLLRDPIKPGRKKGSAGRVVGAVTGTYVGSR